MPPLSSFAARSAGRAVSAAHGGKLLVAMTRRRRTHALYRAAEEDSATGGPDLVRGIFPVVATITAQGYERVDDAELRTRVEAIIAGQGTGS